MPGFITFGLGAGGVANTAVATVSPSEGSDIVATTPIVVDVTGETSTVDAEIRAKYAGQAVEEVIYRDGDFAENYRTSSKTTITGGFRLTLRRDGGWPGSPTITPAILYVPPEE